MKTGAEHYSIWLSRYAKLVVIATFGLLFAGGLVTSHQAGMAVPDWPLSFGSLNPDNWWATLPIRLEHGHRLYAAAVGLLTTILCAWIWRNGWALLWATAAAAALVLAFTSAGASRITITHLGIWSFAGIFAIALLVPRRDEHCDRITHWLAFAAFIGIALQATFGGLRVTLESAGQLQTALTLRIVHGCIAQAELCLLVAIAAFTSPLLRSDGHNRTVLLSSRMRGFAWAVVAAVFAQLILGAAMRHLGAGLAIPTFPQAAPDGSWWPPVHNVYVELHFAHTRFGSLLVTGVVVLLAARVIRAAGKQRLLVRPAWLILGLVALQFALGVFVIWHGKPPTLTTFHVVNGAALLAGTVLLAIRMSATRIADNASRPVRHDRFAEAAV